MSYRVAARMVDGVLMKRCADCEGDFEANATNFYPKGALRFDNCCRVCRKIRDGLRRSSSKSTTNTPSLDRLRFIAEMRPEERRERNRQWCRSKLAELGLTPAQIKAHFGVD